MFEKKDIYRSLKKAGLKSGDNILVKSDLRYLGEYYSQQNLCKDLFSVISEIINLKKGTLFVSTASTALCNSNKIFNLNTTKSERGVFSNFVLELKKSIRSIHPFLSYTGIGKYAEYVCKKNTRHAYGPNSPKDRMLKVKTKYLSIGLPPQLTCSYIHHVEMMMGVPYRYTKEFKSRVKTKNKIRDELYYIYVNYLNSNLKRDLNKKLFKYCVKKGLKINQVNLGKGKIYIYDCNEFVNQSIEFLSKDIYGWCAKKPSNRPYQK